MAQVDQLLKALVQREAEALLLVANEQASLKFGAETRPLINQTLSAAQIKRLLSEFVSADDLARAENQDTRFRYHLDTVGDFVGNIKNSGGILVVTIVSDKKPPAEPPARGPEGPVTQEFRAVAANLNFDSRPQDRHKLDPLLRTMVDLGASDLHLCVGSRPMVRVDGSMRELESHAFLTSEETEGLISEVMPDRNREEFEARNDTDFAYEIPQVARFRCNAFRDRQGMGGVFRQIPSRILSPEELGLSEAVLKLCYLSKGLVLVTGPTGSGKTTTLATLIDVVNQKRRDHIITIEDPIEFVHPNKGCLINQREVGVHTESFKQALRAALREDPDVVLVGEMRDLETIAIAIETAVTGHLVFGTLHTSTAVQTIDRIIDQFPADRQSQVRVMLADCLKGVLSQTLLRRKGGGRVAALEVLLGTQSSTNLIREAKTYQLPSVMQTSRNQGMILLNDALVELVKQDLIEPKEAYVKSVDKDQLVNQFKKNQIPIDFL